MGTSPWAWVMPPRGAWAEEDLCVNASYAHRVDDPAHYNFCPVPESGADAILFIALAMVCALAFSSRISSITTILLGGAFQALSLQFNIPYVSNALTLWLGMHPSEIFVYIFLPPLLMDSAVRLDFHILKKVLALALLLAFVLVIMSTLVSVPLLLYGLGLRSQGWTWVHCGLFSAMIASTDAVAVSSTLKTGHAPEILGALLEGESLFNDASGLLMFDVFRRFLAREQGTTLGAAAWLPAAMAGKHRHADDTAWEQVQELVAELVWLAGGGAVMGLFFAFISEQSIKWLQRAREKPHLEVTVTVAGTYLAFYVTNLWLGASGVIACVVYGLYGATTMYWNMSLQSKREHSMARFWDVVVYQLNAVLFFFVGASSVNFLVRLSADLDASGAGHWALATDILWTLPWLYLTFFLMRGAFIWLVALIARRIGMQAQLSWKGVLFVTMAGLRGALSLVLAQTVLNTKAHDDDGTQAIGDKRVLAQMGLYTTGVVLLTLLINGPLLGPLLKVLKINQVSSAKQRVRDRVRRALGRYTERTLAELQAESDTTEFRSVDWQAVKRYVNIGVDRMYRALPEAEEEGAAPQPGARNASALSRRGSAALKPADGPGDGAVAAKLSKYASADVERGLSGLTTPLLQHQTVEEGNEAAEVDGDGGGAVDGQPHTPVAPPSPLPQRAQGVWGASSASRQPSSAAQLPLPHVASNVADNSSSGARPPSIGVRPSSTGFAAADLQYEVIMQHAHENTCFFASPGGAEGADVAPLTSLSLSSSQTSLDRPGESGRDPLLDPELRALSGLPSDASQVGRGVAGDLDAASGDEEAADGQGLSRIKVPDDAELERFAAEIAATQAKAAAAGTAAVALQRAPSPSFAAATSPRPSADEAASADPLSHTSSPPQPRNQPTPFATSHSSSPALGDTATHAASTASGAAAGVTARRTPSRTVPAALEVRGPRAAHPLLSTAPTRVTLHGAASPAPAPAAALPPRANSRRGGGDNSVLTAQVQRSVMKMLSRNTRDPGSPSMNQASPTPSLTRRQASAAASGGVTLSTSGSDEDFLLGRGGGGAPGGARDPELGRVNSFMSSLMTPDTADEVEETLSEYRIRLLASFKRAFHARHVEGLLSSRGLRTLDSCCDEALDAAETSPLDLWQRIEHEVSGRAWVRMIAALHLRTRKAYTFARYSGACGVWMAAPLLHTLSYLLGSWLSRAMVVGVEVAIEVQDALTSTPQALWIAYVGGEAGLQLQKEVAEQRQLVWKYLRDREIEAPERYQAIQTHRATLAVLRSQLNFVAHLFETGMIEQHEYESLVAPVERQMWKKETRGPKWMHPNLLEVLASVPFLSAVDREILEWIRSEGRLMVYPKGARIFPTKHAWASGIFIVVAGMVRITVDATYHRGWLASGLDSAVTPCADVEPLDDEARYVGTGGVGGLTASLLGANLGPGQSSLAAHAEGNALGKGPIIFHFPAKVLARIRNQAAQGDARFKALEEAMFRAAGINMLDRIRPYMIAYVVQLLALQHQHEGGPLSAGFMTEGNGAPEAAVQPPIARRRSTTQPSTLPGAGGVGRKAGWLPDDLGGGGRREGLDGDDGVPDHLSAGLSDEEDGGEVSQRLIQRYLDVAVNLHERVRGELHSARLVHLVPRQRISQTSFVVLMSGSMVQTSGHVTSATARGASASTAPSGEMPPSGPRNASADHPAALPPTWLPVHKAPKLLVWLPEFLDRNFLGDYGLDGGATYTAGPTGATLLLCASDA